MIRSKSRLISATKKYISELGYKSLMVPDSGSLVLLKEGGNNSHYLIIVIAGQNKKWEQEMRYFNLSKLKANTFEDAKKGIAKYLKNGK